MVKRAKIAAIPKKNKISKKIERVEAEPITTRRTRGGKTKIPTKKNPEIIDLEKINPGQNIEGEVDGNKNKPVENDINRGVVTNEGTRTGKMRAGDQSKAKEKQQRLTTKEKGEKSNGNATEDEGEGAQPKKKPEVVDLDSVDLRQYINNRVESIKNEPKVTDIDRDISEYIDIKIQEKLPLKEKDETSARVEREEEEKKQIRAALNSKKMLCNCCENGNHHANLANLTWHTDTQKWTDNQGEVRPMTPINAWVHAKKMLANIKRGVDPDNTWYKCIMCDERDNNLIDVHFGIEQLSKHIIRYHRTTFNIYRDIYNGLEWADGAVTRRFKHIMMNVHREDYDNQLWRAKGRSMAARTGSTRKETD